MLWALLLACAGQGHECDRATDYVRHVDEDGTTAAERDRDGADCSDRNDSSVEAACAETWEAEDTLDTCIAECEYEETEAYQECDVACRDAASDGPHTDEAAWFLCSQGCPDQPTWTCP